LAGLITPLLSGVPGIVRVLNGADLQHFLIGLALGTLGTTFAVWVFIDPLAGLIEMLLPPSRKYRAQRLANAEAERRSRQEKREHLIAEAFTREEQERQRWHERLRPHAERLAALSANQTLPAEQAEKEALHIGALAWRLGGLTCMRQLRDMTLKLVEQQQGREETIDYISYWWDGIGKWRRPTLG
jgi:glycine/D-amino acid oxidase-like deaminating enzyme